MGIYVGGGESRRSNVAI